MTIDDWRARYGHLNDEADRLRAEVERLREDAARARWCEENKADVVWDWRGNQWRCETAEDMWMDQDRNAAIDYVRTGVPFWQSTAVEAERDAARAGEARAVEALEAINATKYHLKRIIKNRQADVGNCRGPVTVCDCSECHATQALERLQKINGLNEEQAND